MVVRLEEQPRDMRLMTAPSTDGKGVVTVAIVGGMARLVFEVLET